MPASVDPHGGQFDPKLAADTLRTLDDQLAAVIDRVGPCTMRPRRRLTPFQALVKSVVFQQISGHAAAAIYARLLAILPTAALKQPQAVLDLTEDDLKACGLSRMKVGFIKTLAENSISGVIPSSRRIRSMTDDQIMADLLQIRGIGPWSVEMLLMFALGRNDRLPATDLALRKGFQVAFELEEIPAPAAILDRGERWRPYRTVASWYLWAAAEPTDSPGCQQW